MTLGEFFTWLSGRPDYVIGFFVFIPLIAFLAGIMGKGEGNLSPWKYFYAALIYAICVPGIFAVTLNIYFFLFERQKILDTNLFTQVLPIVSMVATLLIIRANADLNHIPGFGKLSGLIMMISAVLVMMWFLDRTHIVAFTYIRFEVFILILVVMLVIARLGWSRLFRTSS